MRIFVKCCVVVLMIGCMLLTGCGPAEDVDFPEPGKPDPLRELFSNELANPAVYKELPVKTELTKIQIGGDRESYDFFVSWTNDRQSQMVAQTETDAIRIDFATIVNSQTVVTDMHSFETTSRDRAYISVGGIDDEGSYASKASLDRGSMSVPFDLATGVSFQGKRSFFTGVDRANSAGEELIGSERNFYLIGNSYDDAGNPKPFIASVITRWNFSTVDAEINTVFYPADLPGIEFIKFDYKPYDGVYIMGYDVTTSEIVMMYFKEIDVKENERHEKEDSYQKTWSVRLTGLKVDRELVNFAMFKEQIFVAGEAQTKAGDLAGKLIALDKTNGSIKLDSLYNYTDMDDGFVGVTASGQNIFAYGYSHRESSGSDVTKSNGWALQFSKIMQAMYHVVYLENNAVIRFTAAVGGYEQSDFNEHGTLAIGGSRKTSTGYAAFATEFRHRYKPF
jgi:hypothetical protein